MKTNIIGDTLKKEKRLNKEVKESKKENIKIVLTAIILAPFFLYAFKVLLTVAVLLENNNL